jgi:hypothetical protein
MLHRTNQDRQNIKCVLDFGKVGEPEAILVMEQTDPQTIRRAMELNDHGTSYTQCGCIYLLSMFSETTDREAYDDPWQS